MANGTLKVSNIQTSSGSGTITIGQSGETITIPSGATVSGAGANTPAFEARRTDNQTLSDSSWTKVQFPSEIFDTNSAYDASTNFRFTVPSGEAGKYFIYSNLRFGSSSTNDVGEVYTAIYKNGSSFLYGVSSTYNAHDLHEFTQPYSATLDLSASDYIEIFGFIDVSGGTPQIRANSNFGAYRIIGA